MWTETVASHRQVVREAILAAADGLVRDRGFLGVTMSQLAQSSGVSRATLYKYFRDVEQVLAAWHDQRVGEHLAELSAVSSEPGPPDRRLRAVLDAYAQICRNRRQHGADGLADAWHRSDDHDQRQRHLLQLIGGLLCEAAGAGGVRTDVPVDELAGYCVHALAAADGQDPDAAARLVDVVWAGLTSTPPTAR